MTIWKTCGEQKDTENEPHGTCCISYNQKVAKIYDSLERQSVFQNISIQEIVNGGTKQRPDSLFENGFPKIEIS